MRDYSFLLQGQEVPHSDELDNSKDSNVKNNINKNKRDYNFLSDAAEQDKKNERFRETGSTEPGFGEQFLKSTGESIDVGMDAAGAAVDWLTGGTVWKDTSEAVVEAIPKAWEGLTGSEEKETYKKHGIAESSSIDPVHQNHLNYMLKSSLTGRSNEEKAQNAMLILNKMGYPVNNVVYDKKYDNFIATYASGEMEPVYEPGASLEDIGDFIDASKLPAATTAGGLTGALAGPVGAAGGAAAGAAAAGTLIDANTTSMLKDYGIVPEDFSTWGRALSSGGIEAGLSLLGSGFGKIAGEAVKKVPGAIQTGNRIFKGEAGSANILDEGNVTKLKNQQKENIEKIVNIMKEDKNIDINKMSEDGTLKTEILDRLKNTEDYNKVMSEIDLLPSKAKSKGFSFNSYTSGKPNINKDEVDEITLLRHGELDEAINNSLSGTSTSTSSLIKNVNSYIGESGDKLDIGPIAEYELETGQRALNQLKSRGRNIGEIIDKDKAVTSQFNQELQKMAAGSDVTDSRAAGLNKFSQLMKEDPYNLEGNVNKEVDRIFSKDVKKEKGEIESDIKSLIETIMNQVGNKEQKGLALKSILDKVHKKDSKFYNKIYDKVLPEMADRKITLDTSNSLDTVLEVLNNSNFVEGTPVYSKVVQTIKNLTGASGKNIQEIINEGGSFSNARSNVKNKMNNILDEISVLEKTFKENPDLDIDDAVKSSKKSKDGKYLGVSAKTWRDISNTSYGETIESMYKNAEKMRKSYVDTNLGELQDNIYTLKKLSRNTSDVDASQTYSQIADVFEDYMEGLGSVLSKDYIDLRKMTNKMYRDTKETNRLLSRGLGMGSNKASGNNVKLKTDEMSAGNLSAKASKMYGDPEAWRTTYDRVAPQDKEDFVRNTVLNITDDIEKGNVKHDKATNLINERMDFLKNNQPKIYRKLLPEVKSFIDNIKNHKELTDKMKIIGKKDALSKYSDVFNDKTNYSFEGLKGKENLVIEFLNDKKIPKSLKENLKKAVMQNMAFKIRKTSGRTDDVDVSQDNILNILEADPKRVKLAKSIYGENQYNHMVSVAKLYNKYKSFSTKKEKALEGEGKETARELGTLSRIAQGSLNRMAQATIYLKDKTVGFSDRNLYKILTDKDVFDNVSKTRKSKANSFIDKNIDNILIIGSQSPSLVEIILDKEKEE